MHPFVRSVAALRFAHCFNPYADRCDVHDHVDGPARRARTLSAILEQAEQSGVDAIWIGRDLGYKGGRRTGLALTDDVWASDHAARWKIGLERPTIGAFVAERTAKVIWDLLGRIDGPIFLWNAFPLHPHEPATPFSNRQHNSAERRAGEEILDELVRRLRPRRLIAIGNDAAKSTERVRGAEEIRTVRHPSYGGQTDFIRQISNIYPIREIPRLI